MAGQVFQGRSPLRRSILGAVRVAAFVAAGALLIVIVASAIAPSSGPLDESPFVSEPGGNPVLSGAQNAIGAAASAIAAPFRPASTPTPSPTLNPTASPVPTPQPTVRGGQPSTPPGQLRTPQPTPTHP
jgi:hypothetical protein